MATIQAIDPNPIRLHKDRWETLYLSQQHDVRMDRNHLTDVLEAIGQGKGWWYDFFETIQDDGFLLYDLSTVFTHSQSIKRAEKGYNPEEKNQPQIGTVLAFSTASGLPVGVDVFWGSMHDIQTFKEFLDLADPSDVGYIVDKGLVSEELIRDFSDAGISYVAPLKKDSNHIDLRWLNWTTFTYRDRSLRYARRHPDEDTLGICYIFEDPMLKAEQEQALHRRKAEGKITKEEYDEQMERAGIIAFLSDLDEDGSVIYELYKERHEVELAFGAMKGPLDADKSHLQSDEAVRGYFFMIFLALRIYFKVLTRLREEDLTSEISVEEVFFKLSKVERIIGPGEKDSFAKIPEQAREIAELFPDVLARV